MALPTFVTPRQSTQSIRDTYHKAAVACGLEHVGGHGAYSDFRGTRAQWSALLDHVQENRHVYGWRSADAAVARIEWAIIGA